MTPFGAAEAAAQLMRGKYADIIQSNILVPTAMATLGPVNMDGQRLFDHLGERLSPVSGDPSETAFLYQIISVMIQIFNLVAFRGSFPAETVTEG